MPKNTEHDEALTLLAENVGEIREEMSALRDERTSLEAARSVLDAAVKGLGALHSQVLSNDIAKLQLSINDKSRALAQEIARFEIAVAEIDRRAEEGDATLKQELAAESAKLKAEAEALRTELAQTKEWGTKVELSLKEHAQKLAAIPSVLAGAEGRSPNPRGKYESGQKYARLDIVEVAGSSFISSEDENSEKPGRSSQKWKLLAKRGGGGASGPGGPNVAGVPVSVAEGGTGQTSLTAGLLVGNGTNGVIGRTLTGTASQITVTNGTGVSGNPTLSLPTAIVGVDSFTATAATNLTLAGGSSGASLVLGPGANANATVTPSGTGQFVVAGGLINGGSGSLQVNNTLAAGLYSLRVVGAAGADRDILIVGASGLSNGFTVQRVGSAMKYIMADGNLLIGGTTDISGSGGLKVFGTTAATSTTSGAFQCAGGGSFQGALWTGGLINAGGNINTSAAGGNPTISATITAAGSAGQFPLFQLVDQRAGGTTWNIENGRTVGTLSFRSSGGEWATINGTTGVFAISGTTEATTGGAGSLTTAGGIYAAKKIITASTLVTALAAEWDLGAAASVSPTSPNRTIRIKIGGTDYYLHAKTTND